MKISKLIEDGFEPIGEYMTFLNKAKDHKDYEHFINIDDDRNNIYPFDRSGYRVQKGRKASFVKDGVFYWRDRDFWHPVRRRAELRSRYEEEKKESKNLYFSSSRTIDMFIESSPSAIYRNISDYDMGGELTEKQWSRLNKVMYEGVL